MRALRLAVVLLSICATAAADLVDPGRTEVWAEWRDQPLDLRHAGRGAIALLPDADAALAEAVVALREENGLGTWDDLLNVPGITPAVLEDWRPLARVGVETGLVADVASAARITRVRTRGRRGALRGASTWRSGPDGALVRGWAEITRQRWSFVAGGLRVVSGSGLGIGDRIGRGGGDVAPAPDAARVRGRTDSGSAAAWRGAALRTEGIVGRALVVVGRAPDGAEAVAVDWANAASPTTRWGGHVVVHDERRALVGAWWRRTLARGRSVWFETAADPRGGTGATVVGASMRGEGWRIESALARADRATAFGRDPVGGGAFDRPRTSWSTYGRWRRGHVSAEASVRRREWIVRDTRQADRRSRFSVRWSDRGADGVRWTARGRFTLDEELGGPSAGAVIPATRLVLERSVGATRWRATWGRAGAPSATAEGWALDWRGPGPHPSIRRVALALAHASGPKSVAWTLVRPLDGPRPFWVPARGAAVWGSVEWGGDRAGWGAWGSWRGPHDAGSWAWGVAARIALGSMV